MSDGDKTFYRAAIFTAIPLEYQAVCAHLTNLREEKTTLETMCQRGEFLAKNQKWDVIVVETGAGTTQAAAKTVYIIGQFRPRVMIFVGIAGGIKDVKLGDIVVASKVYSYEPGRADPFFQSRPQVHYPTSQILQRARIVAMKKDWLKRLKENPPDSDPKEAQPANIFIAPIASGNQVVASIEATALQLVRSHFNDAIAIEMEGAGFHESARLYQEIEALIIRGISDLIKDKNETAQQQSQPLAAKRASAFAFEVLANLDQEEQAIIKKGSGVVPEPPQETGQGKESQTLSLLEAFNKSLPDYMNQVKKIRDSLDQRTGFSTEQHRTALKELDTIEKHINTLLDAESLARMTSTKALLTTMQTRIHNIKPELEKCRRTSPDSKSSQSRRAKNNEYDRAVMQCDTLLEDLKQWLGL